MMVMFDTSDSVGYTEVDKGCLMHHFTLHKKPAVRNSIINLPAATRAPHRH